MANRRQHTEDRYEIIQDRVINHTNIFISSTSFTWYTVNEALDLLRQAGYEDVQAHADFEFVPAAADETSYIALGRRPTEPA